MFTGLIEETGKVVYLKRSSTSAELVVKSSLTGLKNGDSVAVNGVCQTIKWLREDTFACDVLPETLRVTNLGGLGPGVEVNLERALMLSDRLGGHLVNGHIDGTGIIRTIIRDPLSIEIGVSPEITRFLVSKGSVAIDGISLTLGPDVTKDSFKVYIIPHTMENTCLRNVRPGSNVNIEVDILAKYVDKLTNR
ncbi:MAG: riboflavin synthase [Bacteroidales bacterium]|nr:riboflavin synthase [Candidatus Latescibacterota bacterium]